MRNLLELVMIVKNSESIIEPTLTAAAQFADRYTILDTGSTDNTVAFIRELCSRLGFKGNVYQEPFVDFSTSRNRALELAFNRSLVNCDKESKNEACLYTIMLDDTYVLQGGKALRKFLKKESSSCFSVALPTTLKKEKTSFFISIEAESERYFSCRILKSGSGLRYKYKVHEVVDTVYTNYVPSEVYIMDPATSYGGIRSKLRFKRDVELLQTQLTEALASKDRGTAGRSVYYLAKTWLALEEKDKAVEQFQRRTRPPFVVGVKDEELFHSYYLLGSIYLKEPFRLPAGESVLQYLNKAYELMPHRAEPFYRMAVYHYKHNEMKKAIYCLEKAVACKPPTTYLLEVYFRIYEHDAPYLLMQSYMNVGRLKETLELCNKVTPSDPSFQPFLNIRYNLSRYFDLIPPLYIISDPKASKTIVFHIGGMVKNLLISSIHVQASGSEIMAVELAKEFHRRGYRVVMIGSFSREPLSFSRENEKRGIEYVDLTDYQSFILNNHIDYLIVSRDSNNLAYYDNIGRVYLWLHDILPIGDVLFQTHKKFKRVLTLSKWHKNYFVNEYGIPPEMVYVTRNATDVGVFTKGSGDLKKIPFRFIYSSSPDRGLDVVLKIVTVLRSRYPTLTLAVFCKEEYMTEEMKETIRSNSSFITNHGRVEKERLAREYLQSDVWLYPTYFQETYCITALEAQLARCLCVYSGLAGLTDTVGNRGIVLNSSPTNQLEELTGEVVRKLDLVLDSRGDDKKTSLKKSFLDRAYNWALQQTYSGLADDWERNLFSLP